MNSTHHTTLVSSSTHRADRGASSERRSERDESVQGGLVFTRTRALVKADFVLVD